MRSVKDAAIDKLTAELAAAKEAVGKAEAQAAKIAAAGSAVSEERGSSPADDPKYAKYFKMLKMQRQLK